jgi:hypothetical protein
MAPTANPRVILAKHTTSELPVAEEHIVFDPTPTIDLDLELNGGYLTKTLLLRLALLWLAMIMLNSC